MQRVTSRCPLLSSIRSASRENNDNDWLSKKNSCSVQKRNCTTFRSVWLQMGRRGHMLAEDLKPTTGMLQVSAGHVVYVTLTRSLDATSVPVDTHTGDSILQRRHCERTVDQKTSIDHLSVVTYGKRTSTSFVCRLHSASSLLRRGSPHVVLRISSRTRFDCSQQQRPLLAANRAGTGARKALSLSPSPSVR